VLARNDKRNAANERTRRYRERLGKDLSIAPTPVNDAIIGLKMPTWMRRPMSAIGQQRTKLDFSAGCFAR
jgi:hypothetical protein